MELAGLSVAQAIYKQYDRKAFPRVLVVAGWLVLFVVYNMNSAVVYVFLIDVL